MALYNRGSLDPNASAGSGAYRTAARQHFQADLDPARRQAQQELADEYGGRGLAPSGGQAVAALLANRNSFIQQLLQQDQKLGLRQADMGEADRQNVEGRGWQVEDQKKAQELEDEFARWNKEDYEAYRQGKAKKKLMKGITGFATSMMSGGESGPGFQSIGSAGGGGETYGQIYDRGVGAAPVVRAY